MDVQKLQGIVANKNERLEREALQQAEDIIETIAAKQELISHTWKEIEGLRNRLSALEIKQLDSQTLLGE